MKITRRQIENALLMKIDSTEERTGALERSRAHKVITPFPIQSGSLETAGIGQFLKDMVFDTAGDIDSAPEGRGYIALSGGEGRRLRWDGVRFFLEEEDGGGTTSLVFYDASLPENRWLRTEYTFDTAAAITEINVANRGEGAWPLTTYSYQPPASILDFPEHAADKGNPHTVTAAQVGTYTKEEIDGKDNALANLTYYYKAYWFGRRVSSTPWPLPAEDETWAPGARNGFDFETNTPWEWDGSQWAEEASVPAANGTVIGISSAFLDITEAGFAGLARYSEEAGDWDFYPDKYSTMDPLVFEKDANEQETLKEKGVQGKHLADEAIQKISGDIMQLVSQEEIDGLIASPEDAQAGVLYLVPSSQGIWVKNDGAMAPFGFNPSSLEVRNEDDALHFYYGGIKFNQLEVSNLILASLKTSRFFINSVEVTIV